MVSKCFKAFKEAIRGLSMTNDHYVEACNILQLRYGREDLCIFRHIQELLGIIHQGQTAYSF